MKRKEKCRYADEYKAIFAPYCDGGRVCLSCQAKWEQKCREEGLEDGEIYDYRNERA